MFKKFVLIISLVFINSCISDLSDAELKDALQVSINQKNWKKALNLVEESIKRKPDDTIQYFYKALCLNGINPYQNNKEIINNLNIYLQNNPTSSTGHLLMYTNCYANKQYGKAINDVEKLEKYYGISSQTLLMKANAQFLNKSYKEAALNYEDLFSYPNSDDFLETVYYYKIYAKYFSGNVDGATWDTGFLENYGFKRNDSLFKAVIKRELVIDGLDKIPFFAETTQFDRQIRPEIGLNYDFLFRPIYENLLRKSKKYDVNDLKSIDKNIQILDLSNQNISELPRELKLFKRLKALKISKNKIKDFDAFFNQLAQLDSLEYLNIDYSNLKNFPKSIYKLSKLKGLSMQASNIHELPREIGALFNLSYLSLNNNGHLKHLPKEIRHLKNLNVLDVSGSGMEDLIEEVSLCYELISIKTSDANIHKLPNNIGKLKLLNKLNFGYNAINELPESIGELYYLTDLSLGSNDLQTLPESIKNLSNLKELSLELNRFKTFPKVILKIQNLETLWLHNNNIPYIPLEISQMKKLSSLLVDHEIITDENINQIKKQNPNIEIKREDARKYVSGAKRKQ